MKIIIEKDYLRLCNKVAKLLKEEIEKKPDMILGLATGSTTEGIYKELIKYHEQENLDFSKIKTFNLDEYVGLVKNHQNSHRYIMNKIFFNNINIKLENTYLPKAYLNNLEYACEEYENLIDKNGGIDIQILGIGTNGHIAYLEPNEEIPLSTSVIYLNDSTIKDKSHLFNSIEEVPKKAITLGISQIFKAKKIFLVASGKSKASIINQLINLKSISTTLPASILLLHNDLTILIDETINIK